MKHSDNETSPISQGSPLPDFPLSTAPTSAGNASPSLAPRSTSTAHSNESHFLLTALEQALTASPCKAELTEEQTSSLLPGYQAAKEEILRFTQIHLHEKNALDNCLKALGEISPLPESSYFTQTEEITALAEHFMRHCHAKPELFKQIENNLLKNITSLADHRQQHPKVSHQQNARLPLSPKKASATNEFIKKEIITEKLSSDEIQAQRIKKKEEKKQKKALAIAKQKKGTENLLTQAIHASGTTDQARKPQPCIMFTLIECHIQEGIKKKLCLISLSGHEEKALNLSSNNGRDVRTTENWKLLAKLTDGFNEINSARLNCKFYFLNHHSNNTDDMFLHIAKDTSDNVKEDAYRRKCAEGKICHTLIKLLEQYGTNIQIQGGVAISFFPAEQPPAEEKFLQVDNAYFAIKPACTACMHKKESILTSMLAIATSKNQQQPGIDFSPTRPKSSNTASFFSPYRSHFTSKRKIDAKSPENNPAKRQQRGDYSPMMTPLLSPPPDLTRDPAEIIAVLSAPTSNLPPHQEMPSFLYRPPSN